jgi:hypothetical protein
MHELGLRRSAEEHANSNKLPDGLDTIEVKVRMTVEHTVHVLRRELGAETFGAAYKEAERVARHCLHVGRLPTDAIKHVHLEWVRPREGDEH